MMARVLYQFIIVQTVGQTLNVRCPLKRNQKQMKNKIVEAIEKQIPLKPIYKKAFNDSMTMPHCAECHKILEGFIYYCPRCGQKIDWE
jgi:uncharacterized paraquat-inducible protein A